MVVIEDLKVSNMSTSAKGTAEQLGRNARATSAMNRLILEQGWVVCVESLKVKNMIRNPSQSKAIADAGWGEFTRQLQYKGNGPGWQC